MPPCLYQSFGREDDNLVRISIVCGVAQVFYDAESEIVLESLFYFKNLAANYINRVMQQLGVHCTSD